MPIPLVSLNVLIYTVLGLYALKASARSGPGPVRLLWRLAALPALAVALGGVQRLALQIAQAGWLPNGSFDVLLFEWQIGQSILVAAIGVAMFVGIRGVERRFAELESVAGAMLGRLAHVDVTSIALTPREQEVLDILGGSTFVDDKTLSEKLGVSPNTVHTHIGTLLKKTKLNDRRDLAVLAYLLHNGEHPPLRT